MARSVAAGAKAPKVSKRVSQPDDRGVPSDFLGGMSDRVNVRRPLVRSK